MKTVCSLADLANAANRVCLAIGVFDGVHLGHQQVIRTAATNAQSCQAQSVVLTFDPHPMRVLQPAKAPLLLTATGHKLRLIEQLGVDMCLLIPFDEAFARTTAGDFIARIAGELPELREICVGSRFRFGYRRLGDMQLIRSLSARYGYIANEIPSVAVDGETVSSTAVRSHVLQGRLEPAAKMLGRPFSVLGTVEPGRKVGRELGFPTANLNSHNEVLPPVGVYAVHAIIGGTRYGGVVNIGVRPTFATDLTEQVLELHILDFADDIYGRDVEVEFFKYIRPEQKFASAAELKQQITADIALARHVLG